jgi:hypothetical protein
LERERTEKENAMLMTVLAILLITGLAVVIVLVGGGSPTVQKGSQIGGWITLIGVLVIVIAILIQSVGPGIPVIGVHQ